MAILPGQDKKTCHKYTWNSPSIQTLNWKVKATVHVEEHDYTCNHLIMICIILLRKKSLSFLETFCKTFKSNSVPDQLKVARVVPIHKKGYTSLVLVSFANGCFLSNHIPFPHLINQNLVLISRNCSRYWEAAITACVLLEQSTCLLTPFAMSPSASSSQSLHTMNSRFINLLPFTFCFFKVVQCMLKFRQSLVALRSTDE